LANGGIVEPPVIRPQYHFRRVGEDVHIWDVRGLIALADGLRVYDVPLRDIAEIDEPYWFDATDGVASCRAVMDHAQHVAAADLTYPVLLCAQGRVLDGMHRIMKAHGAGQAAIVARRFVVTPPPDFVNQSPDDLSY
jgi:hypothetical protein